MPLVRTLAGVGGYGRGQEVEVSTRRADRWIAAGVAELVKPGTAGQSTTPVEEPLAAGESQPPATAPRKRTRQRAPRASK